MTEYAAIISLDGGNILVTSKIFYLRVHIFAWNWV